MEPLSSPGSAVVSWSPNPIRLTERTVLELGRHRFLVTGGAGFFGSHVVEELIERGVSEDRIFVPRSADYDLRKRENVVGVYEDADPDIVIHLAATVGGIGANQAHPGKFFYENLMMGVHLMEEARRREIEKFVSVGTVCAYPKHTPIPFREENLWDGYPEETNAPYGIAKRALLVQGRAYREEYGLSAIYLLPVNLYGPRDDFDPQTSHVIPAIIKKCIEARDEGGQKVVAWGDGSPTREFLYVEDAARGLVRATERYGEPQPVNLGGNREISIRELVEMIVELTGFGGRIEWDTSKPNGQPRRSVDATRAKERFGFEPEVPLREGLKRTISWYRKVRGAGSPE